jgi:uroporphyrinogen decarboxylase
MSHRERVIRTLKHQEPDRVPFDLGSSRNSSIHVAGYQRLKSHLGIKAPDALLHKFMQIAMVDEAVLQKLDIDFRCVAPGHPDVPQDKPVGEDGYQDEYGVTRRKPHGSLYYDMVKSPLSGPLTVKDVIAYRFPDAKDPGYVRGIREKVDYYRQNTDCAIVLSTPSVFVHLSQFLRGFEDWFIDLATDQKLAGVLFDACTEHTAAVAVEVIKAAGGDRIDILATGDDLGTQSGPIISPELYRKVFKPRHKKFMDIIKKHTSAFIHFHSCGSIYKLLGDLIDIGVDAIHPVQVAAKDMDSAKLKKEFGKHLTFWGGIDTQKVMPKGTPQDVKEEVRRRIQDFAPGGGYVLAAVHNIQADVPPENILAMFQAGKEYGTYPIQR